MNGKIITHYILFFYNILMFSSKVLQISKAAGHTFVATVLEVCGDEWIEAEKSNRVFGAHLFWK